MSDRTVFTRNADEITPKRVRWLWRDHVPLSAFTLLAGLPGLGKSQLACLLMSKITRGELGADPATVLYAGAEDSIESVIIPRLMAVRADLKRVKFLVVADKDIGEDGLTIPDDVPGLEERAHELGAVLVTIDPLNAHISGSVDTHKDAPLRRAIAPIARLSDRLECASIGIVHLNKDTSKEALNRINGSVGYGGAARSALLFARDPDDDDDGDLRVLAQMKSNYGKLAKSTRYQIDPVLIPAADGHEELETSRLIELGECDFSASEVLADRKAETPRGNCVEFLKELLADGPVLAVEALEQATTAGYKSRTIDRAKKDLGVESKKLGGGLESPWY